MSGAEGLLAKASALGAVQVTGDRWSRFGKYNILGLLREDGEMLFLKTHAGELVPGGTEDMLAFLRQCGGTAPTVPFTLELDATFACASAGCGGACFSSAYRALRPNAHISSSAISAVIADFARRGGRVLRFDGGGEPLLHEGVRSGRLVAEAAGHGLLTTVLTAGDLLTRSAWATMIEAGCYLRVSINAATATTRKVMHGAQSDMERLWRVTEQITGHSAAVAGPPVGATFLLTDRNYHEVADAARRAREVGIAHFSARRVLGPAHLRPAFSAAQQAELADLLAEAASLTDDGFVVLVPTRPLDEPDISPSRGDVEAVSCWQSTFKVVMEPSEHPDRVRLQLCGRYRGGGVGQREQRPPLVDSASASDWVSSWSRSFDEYPATRQSLTSTCSSCIDRGFITTMDALVAFTDYGRLAVLAEHFWADPRTFGEPNSTGLTTIGATTSLSE